MLYLDIIITVLAFFIGLRSPQLIAILLIWTLPYLSGNQIFTLAVIPVRPGADIGIAMAILAIFKTNLFSKNVPTPARFILVLLGYMIVGTGIGIFLLRDSPELNLWLQSPLMRGTRVLLSDMLFWLLPIATYVFTKDMPGRERLLRAMIYSGLFYCALAIIQFGWSTAFGSDIFPMVRNAGTADFWIQDIAAEGLEGRVTSICGEPRYLAVNCLCWITIAWLYGKEANLHGSIKKFALGIFFLTMVLTGSQSGLFGLTFIIGGYFACSVATGGIAGTFKAVVGGLTIILVFWFAIFFGLGVLSERLGNLDPRVYEYLFLFGLPIPLEFTEVASLSAWLSHISSFFFGLGAGLWQYVIDPFDYDSVRVAYPTASGLEMDSVRPNLWILSTLSSYGIVGFFLMISFYTQHFSYIKRVYRRSLGEVLKKGVPLLVLIQFAKSAEILAHVAMYLILFTWPTNQNSQQPHDNNF